MAGDLSTRLRGGAARISGSRFVRNVAAVATGIAAAQVISLVFMPFLTRLYGPEAFGALAAFTAVVNIITPLATLGYANAIVMPETEEGASAVARLSLLCAAVVAPLALLFVFLFQSRLAMWTGLEASPGFLYLIPVALLVGALLSVANQAAVREGLFKAKAGSYVASTLLTNLGKLAGGLLAPSGLLLIAFNLVGSVLNCLMLLARVPRTGVFQVRRWFGLSGVREAASEQRDFALYRMPQSIVNAASVGLPVILLVRFFDSATAGQYSLTVLVLSAPVMLLGQSVEDVFYPKVTRVIMTGSQGAATLLRKATIVLSLLSVGLFGIIVLAGPLLFSIIFGDEWRRAGDYAQWVAISSAGVLASRACAAAYPALRLQGYLLAQTVISLGLRVAALYIGFFYFKSDLAAIALVSLVGLAMTIALCAAAFIRVRSQRIATVS